MSDTDCNDIPATGFVRMSRVCGKNGFIPVSKATWYQWINSGKVPAPTKIGPRCVAYRAETLRQIIDDLSGGHQE